MGGLLQFRQSPPPPAFMGAFSPKGYGQWYAGAVPRGSEEAPILVFVPGLGDVAQNFWSWNGLEDPEWGLYAYAYGEGYRTAFVNFTPKGEKPFDVWQDGHILAWQLEQICSHFGVGQVQLIAHSKGGVDAQTAMVYYGAASRVSRLITLSTPHWGSQLADIAYSSSGWAVAELLQAHSPGCYTMQTGFMDYYRHRTDGKPGDHCKILTFAGRGSGLPLSKTWFGAQMLSRFGPNDGVVTVESAHNPKGEHLATLDLSHEQIKEGRYIWPYLSAALKGRPQPQAASAALQAIPRRCGQILRGGRLSKGVNGPFFIDSSTDRAEITLLLAGETEKSGNPFILSDPSGGVYSGFKIASAGQGVALSLMVDRPEAGEWRLQAPAGEGAYTAVIRLCGGQLLEAEPQTDRVIQKIEIRVFRTHADYSELVYELEVERGDEPLPTLQPGSYLIEAAVHGQKEDGSRFERTVIRSALVEQEDGAVNDLLSEIATMKI